VLVADLNGQCPANLAINYTLAFIPFDETDSTKPQGYGSATLSVSKTGLGTLTGVLGDGTKLSVKAPVSKDGNWPLDTSLYNKNAGSCIGWVMLTTSNATGVVDWFAPNTKGGYAGFSTTLDLIGSEFVANQALAGNKIVTLSGAGLTGNIVKTVTINGGKVTVTDPGQDALMLKLTPKTGQFTGTFVLPAGGKAIPFSGLLLQEQAGGAGLFQHSGKTGGITIEPAP